MESSPTPSGRSDGQYAMHAVAFVALFVLPALVALTFSPETTTRTLLVYLPLASFGLGLADAAWYRFTWSYPAIAAGIFWLSTVLMYNPGTWMYAVGVFLLCALGGAAGSSAAEKSSRIDSPAVQPQET